MGNRKISRGNKIRLIREGIVIYEGDIGSLKRFKDDVREVDSGYECDLNIANYNDIKIGENTVIIKDGKIAGKNSIDKNMQTEVIHTE